MAKAIEQLRSGLVVGHAKLGRRGQERGSVAQQVHDGDTVTVEAEGNLGVRFLGVDAPEVSTPLPGTSQPFIALDDDRWKRVFSDKLSDYLDFLEQPLREHLLGRLNADTAPNHARLADQATTALEDLAGEDLVALGKTKETFAFFLAFAGEVMDRYGRLLCYLHADQHDTPSEQRNRQILWIAGESMITRRPW